MVADAVTVTPSVVAVGLALAACVFGVVGTVGMLIPAWRAVRIPAMSALRAE